MRSGKIDVTGVSIGGSDLKKISKDLKFPFEKSLAAAPEFFDFLKGDSRIATKLSNKVNEIVVDFPAALSKVAFHCPECEADAPLVTGLVLQACRVGKASRVMVQCSRGHWAAYSCAKCAIKIGGIKARKI